MEKGHIKVEDEILRCAQNDKGGTGSCSANCFVLTHQPYRAPSLSAAYVGHLHLGASHGFEGAQVGVAVGAATPDSGYEGG